MSKVSSGSGNNDNLGLFGRAGKVTDKRIERVVKNVDRAVNLKVGDAIKDLHVTDLIPALAVARRAPELIARAQAEVSQLFAETRYVWTGQDQ